MGAVVERGDERDVTNCLPRRQLDGRQRLAVPGPIPRPRRIGRHRGATDERVRLVAKQRERVHGVSPDEIMGIAPVERLLLVAGARPTKCRQVRYYEDRAFTVGR
jgi:hypothetical protein